MRTLLVAANTLAVALSLIWLWGHSSAPASNWEFWFALGYFVLAIANLAYFLRRGRRRYGRDPERPEA